MSGPRYTHIIGAGLAGLSAALHLTLASEKVALYEAAPFAGGRCRSFQDRELGCRIDNGNHLVLSGNAAVQDYLFLSNALNTMGGPGIPEFTFKDLQSNEEWKVRMSKGLMPWWLFNKNRRVAGTSLRDYASAARLLNINPDTKAISLFDTKSVIYRRFWEPLIIGALNTEPEFASAKLLANIFMQSFGAGGGACIPMLPKIGLSETFVQPCLNILKQHEVEVKYNHRLRAIYGDQDCARELDFNGTFIEIPPEDWVILAVPAWFMRDLMPLVPSPTSFRSIINAHYRLDLPNTVSGFCGMVGGHAEWVFVRNGVASVTISCAERYRNIPVRSMAAIVWKEIASLFELDPEKTPPHRIFLEKNATFTASPEQDALRPSAYTGMKNVALAGEWTQTGLPSTIEGALRSGYKAAQIVSRWGEGN